MIRYTVDSTLTLREFHIFNNQGRRNSEDYERNNVFSNGTYLTDRSKRKIKQYVSGYFLENFEHKSNFLWVTLTVTPYLGSTGLKDFKYKYVPEYHDSEVIKLLSKYLNNLRKNHGLKNYVWIAERQDGKRNNYVSSTDAIHFHCIFDFDKFVDYRNLNLYWLKVLNEAGYAAFSEKALKDKKHIFTFDETFKRYSKTLFKSYTWDVVKLDEKLQSWVKKVADNDYLECCEAVENQYFKTGFKGIDPMCIDPNTPLALICYSPVDVDKIKISDMGKLQTYLTKYITKNDSLIYGRCWAASHGFSSIKYDLEITQTEAEEIRKINKMVFAEYETKIDFGTREFINRSYKLNFELFRETEAYRKLMESITTQRLNLNSPPPEIFETLTPSGTLEFVENSFEWVRQNTHENSEVRVNILDINPNFGIMPNENFMNEPPEFVKLEKIKSSFTPVQSVLFSFPLVERVKSRKDKWRDAAKLLTKNI